MINHFKVSVVVPCFNESFQIRKVLATMPKFVDQIICVDDASTDDTLEVLREISQKNKKISIISFASNQGVGAAIDAGYGTALSKGADLIAVMAGDGQMDPNELQLLIHVLLKSDAGYAKITRLYDSKFLNEVPKIRLIGNSILGFLTRMSSGYWTMSDSQTGYTVITRSALKEIQGNLWKGYGFPNDVLNKLALNNFKVVEIPSRPIYGVGEQSKLKPLRVFLPILGLLLRGIRKRIFTLYFRQTIHPIGIGYIFGSLGLLLGSTWLAKIFLFDFISNHNTKPLELISTIFFTQSSFLVLWLTLIFDALHNRDKSTLVHSKIEPAKLETHQI